jgi:hypothetical protein
VATTIVDLTSRQAAEGRAFVNARIAADPRDSVDANPLA